MQYSLHFMHDYTRLAKCLEPRSMSLEHSKMLVQLAAPSQFLA